MVRSGRLTAADLGLGTLTYITPTATRRIFAILSGTTGTGGSACTFTQGVTKMSVVKGAWAVRYDERKAQGTGSIQWIFGSVDGGTFSMNPGPGVLAKYRFLVLVIGTPDELQIV